MIDLKCGSCGAELLAGTNFCRKCGLGIATGNAIESSEEPTAILTKTDTVSTQRLDPRPTSPDRGGSRLNPPAGSIDIATSEEARSRRKMAIGGVSLVIIVVAIVTAVALMKTRTGSVVQSPSGLAYPGAQTVVDMTNSDGSRTIQLQTTDPLARVESWYQTNLSLTKIVRLTSTSVVMKNEKATITLAVENNKTNILIKQLP